jgi:hypothetical protein
MPQKDEEEMRRPRERVGDHHKEVTDRAPELFRRFLSVLGLRDADRPSLLLGEQF